MSKKFPSPKNAVLRTYDLSADVGWLVLVWAEVSGVVLYVVCACKLMAFFKGGGKLLTQKRDSKKFLSRLNGNK